jgi:biopolymer transport protein ExbD
MPEVLECKKRGMARTFHRKNRLSAVTEINVTPLIDLAFALLIIFMITTPLLEQTIPLDLPVESKDSSSQKPKKQEIRNVSIDLDGRYYWGEDEIDIFELKVRIGEIAEMAEPPVVHIRASGGILYQEVVDVLNILKQENLSNISLDTNVK